MSNVIELLFVIVVGGILFSVALILMMFIHGLFKVFYTIYVKKRPSTGDELFKPFDLE